MNKLAVTLAKVKVELLKETSRYVKVNAQVETLHDNLVDAQVRTLCDRLTHVHFEALGCCICATSGGAPKRIKTKVSMRRFKR